MAPKKGHRLFRRAAIPLNAGHSNFGPLKVLVYFVKAPLRIQLLGITLAAVAAAWFWAIAPMTTSLLYIHPSDWTDADLVGHLWHFRLIQPEWVGCPPQSDYLRWTQAELLARLCAVFLKLDGMRIVDAMAARARTNSLRQRTGTHAERHPRSLSRRWPCAASASSLPWVTYHKSFRPSLSLKWPVN